jgi:hypothetical protein
MSTHRTDRRGFLKSSFATAGAAALTFRGAAEADAAQAVLSGPARIKFAAIGLNHDHINGQVDAVIRGGGELTSFFATEPDLIEKFAKRYPQAKLARSKAEDLEDQSIKLVVSAAIPDERAALGIEVMRHGKDYMADKPGMTTLEQLADVRKVQAETKRIYSILYSERHENKATVRAGDLVKAGAIGKVIQTIGLGPHRMNPEKRPAGSSRRRTTAASSATSRRTSSTSSCSSPVRPRPRSSPHRSATPIIRSTRPRGLRRRHAARQRRTGYIRVDWFTPDGLNTWGDGRLTILAPKASSRSARTRTSAGEKAATTCSWSIRSRPATSTALTSCCRTAPRSSTMC